MQNHIESYDKTVFFYVQKDFSYKIILYSINKTMYVAFKYIGIMNMTKK